MSALSLGFSPCPNDTFIFCALVNGWSGTGKPVFSSPRLEDVETLNRWALQGRLDVTKLSFHGLGHVLDEYCAVSVGGALGRGCGPLLVARGNRSLADLEGARVAIPGRYTTAALLFSLFFPGRFRAEEMRFDTIMPAVAAGAVDAGVIIHESRFTFSSYGLVCLKDLGQWWEETSGLPIPLGCIAARRSLGAAVIADIEHEIRESLLFARSAPEKCQTYIRSHAQETEANVIAQHIGLYVNDYSLDLGVDGRRAVTSFFARGRQAGILPTDERSPFFE